MKLIIAEKPSVAKAIIPVVGAKSAKKGYNTGNGYIVSWCFGHLVGLDAPNDYNASWASRWSFAQLPMIPDEWRFHVTDGCKEQYGILDNLLHDGEVGEVICATDADREGECIFRYVYHLSGSTKPVKRLWISSLEESAIRQGLLQMQDDAVYDNLYQAGYCRAKADWLVGMNLTRLFSVRYHARQTLSIGRVMTPTLSMAVSRDEEIEHFIAKPFWKVQLSPEDGSFTAISERIDEKEKALRTANACDEETATVTGISREKKTIAPPKLYDLTSLQRDANRYFGYTAKQTLAYQQSLYEAKLSTYPRTDSRYITSDMKESTQDLLSSLRETFAHENFAAVAVGDNIDACIKDKKVAGHPAILPTKSITKESFDGLPQGEQDILLLEMVRLFEAAGETHEYESTKITVSCEGETFTANGKTIVKNGWKEIENAFFQRCKTKPDEGEDETDGQTLPSLRQGETFTVRTKTTEHKTQPPKSYTEASILSAMEHAGAEEYGDDVKEKKGLGTPATRAATLEKLVAGGFAERKGKKFLSTEKGRELIHKVPPEIASPKLTAEWESKLQQMERGDFSPETFMRQIETYVADLCRKYAAYDESAAFGGETKQYGACPKCGGAIQNGKYGFYCAGKCGMNVGKVFGKTLTEAQIVKLLDGQEITLTSAGKDGQKRKTVVLPEAVENEWNGKVNWQWKTKKG